MGVGADHVGQGVRASCASPGSGGGVPFPVSGELHRVNREHPIPSRDQRGHPPDPQAAANTA
jgi:hypothetical protein